MRITFTLSALLLLLGLPLVAQPLAGSSNEEQLLAAADSARATYNWTVALDNYREAYDKNEDEALLPLIAQMNYELRDVAATIRGYTRAFRRTEASDTTNNIHRFYFGRALKMDEQYDEAVTYLQNFLQFNQDTVLDYLARTEIEGARMYRDVDRESGDVELEFLDRSINTVWSEYSPVLSADGATLYYATADASAAIEFTDANDDGQYVRVYRATRGEEGEWEDPEPLGREVNRPGVHSANPSLSADGRRLYYNRIGMKSNKVAEAKIYLSDVGDDGWKSGNPVGGINSDDYLALQPATGELFGEEVLFFVSDMAGGFGGYDIYYATYRGDGRYASPVNLGEAINTVGDDMTPFYFDGTLYWSTNGLPTMGGTDLFYSAWNGSNWSEATNMGPGFNSSVDDQSLSVYGDGLVGFMTSNRPGEGRSVKSKTCCDDIYGFEIPTIRAKLVVGLFSEDRQPLSNGTIELQPIRNGNPLGDGTQKSRDDGNRFDFGLSLETEYSVVASHPGYYPDTVEINTLGLVESKDYEQVFFLRLDPAANPVYDTIEIEESIALENILYDLDKSDIRPDAEGDLRVLTALMEEYPDLVIELGSHTDFRGDDKYNLNLSKRRADSARRWLIAQGGIAAARIKFKGYGETQPIVVSERLAERTGNVFSAGDTLSEPYIRSLAGNDVKEIAHQLNRRTEFKVLEGPTSIIIRRDIIERAIEGPERNGLPTAPASPPARTDSIAPINPMSTLYGKPAAEVAALPILRFDQRKLELGAVKQGEQRSFTYTFTNTGQVPAKIMLIQACDCTTVTHDNSRVYQPGDSGTLEVVFDSSSKDTAEIIGIDVFLEQTHPTGRPVTELVEYSFSITPQ
ncbi:Peptidoglycan-associated lipoprotein [Neolewinella maritima]|uniref:Peptidoglycan-associated lipoprotein n=1 Tax=Neolewinella maritima TaxID=1383882 RepID=A0ABM9B2J5_9BACT|nr:OmpA family protein [Neolewinella maritima]CAH1001578.1 Peptidoglycan-associated lipoprotein [Neolewinella maritima]